MVVVVDLRWLLWACVWRRWPSLADVGRRCGPSLWAIVVLSRPKGYVGVGVENGGGGGYVVSGDGDGGGHRRCLGK